jgi:polar amino acid transport system permease protein
VTDAGRGGARRARLLDLLAYAALMALAAALLWRGATGMGYDWQWHRVLRYLGAWHEGAFLPGTLLRGTAVTLQLVGAAFVLTTAFGLAAALLARGPSAVGRWLARGYVEVVRNTPLLIQVYLVYFALGPLLGLDRFWAAVLALALFEGAFAAEVFRAGLDGVERGQWEAAAMLSLSPRDTYTQVVLPQAVLLVLPPLVNLAVALVKHSAIVSVIAVAELTTAGRNAVSETFLAFEIWFAVAGIYLVLITAMSAGARALEARMRRGTR